MQHKHEWVPNDALLRDECDFVECGAARDWPTASNRREGIYEAFPNDPTVVVKYPTKGDHLAFAQRQLESAVEDGDFEAAQQWLNEVKTIKTEPDQIDLKRNIGMMQDYLKFALIALNHEQEGNLKYALRNVRDVAVETFNEIERW